MLDIYSDIIGAAETALSCFEETKELLVYPEVQADKAYYLSILSKYNNLKNIKDKLTALTSTLEEEQKVSSMLSSVASDEERTLILDEISLLKIRASKVSGLLADLLGCKHAEECAYCRFKLQESTSKFGTALYSLIKTYLLSLDAKINNEKLVNAKSGYVHEISFVAEGADVIARLMLLTGAHKVYGAQSKCEELCFAVTPSANIEKINESDLKIDVFHSHGAGGQNINKVETAVRVTHLPTGLSVVCQDERSQLKNKKRALDTIEKRIRAKNEQAEKFRMEADINSQFSKKNTPISFDISSNTMADTRLKAFSKILFPLTNELFNSYMNSLIAL